MRNQDSLFDHFCTFIHVKGEGASYETKELISDVGIHEQPTQWKRWSRNKHYTTRGYQSLLRKGGFLENTKRGHWLILREVPKWFTLPHLYTLVGHTYNHVRYTIDGGKYEWRQVPRTEMTRQEILDKLNDVAPKLRAAAEANKSDGWKYTQQLQEKIYFDSIHGNGAFYGAHGYKSTSAQQDPMYYATGTYAQEKSVTVKPSIKVETLPSIDEAPIPTGVTIEKISAEQSTFSQQPDGWKYTQQLQENLMMNCGYVTSALAVLDNADFIDPVMHARVINIMSQLKDLQRTIDERVEYKLNKPTI